LEPTVQENLNVYVNNLQTCQNKKHGWLAELPRTGEIYKKGGYIVVGTTKGYSCKRLGGKGTDKWGGRCMWNYQDLKPKLVFCKRVLGSTNDDR